MPKYQTANFYGLFLLIFLVACSGKEENFQVIKQNEGTTMQSSLSEQDFSNLGNRFVNWVEERQEEDNIPGVAIALVSSQGEEIVLTQGFGHRDLENQLPVTPETLFHIGSTHKSMTAFLIATLVDEGIVDWDTSAIEIYPKFELAEANATENVTLRHLLSMRSGIPDQAEDEFDIDNSRISSCIIFGRRLSNDFNFVNIS